MTDVLTVEQRSYNMSRIRSGETKPEKVLCHLLKTRRIRGFVERPDFVVGKPDFYFRKQRVAIFLDGCFWHGCPQCFRMPTSNRAYWKKKIANNIQRDGRVSRALRSEGIAVLRIRDHQLKKFPSSVIAKIGRKLNRTDG